MSKKPLIVQPQLCGINTSHRAGFEINRPRDPHGSCLILCFRSKAWILCADGMRMAHPGDCVVREPDFRQYHHSVEGEPEGYRNDWLHCAPEAVRPIMRKLRLPFNRALHTGMPEIAAPFIKMMQDEMLGEDSFSNRILINLLEGMLLSIAKNSRAGKKRAVMSGAERAYYNKFSDLRKKTLDECWRNTEIKDLAAQVNLSPERFAALYRKFFNAPPLAEIIDARILRAKRLLLGSSLGIKETAEVCGWSNIFYFSRLFKQKTGLSPSQYRDMVSK